MGAFSFAPNIQKNMFQTDMLHSTAYHRGCRLSKHSNVYSLARVSATRSGSSLGSKMQSINCAKGASMLQRQSTLASSISKTRLFSSSSSEDKLPPPSFNDSVNDTGKEDSLVEIVQDMLWRVRQCNIVPEEVKHDLIDFVVDGVKVGKVTRKVATLLCNSTPPSPSEPLSSSSTAAASSSSSSSTSKNPSIFEIVCSSTASSSSSPSPPCPPFLTLSDEAGKTIKERSDAVMTVMEHLRSREIITGWRDELYPLSQGFYDNPVLFVERAAAPFLGIQQYGVHIIGIVNVEPQGEGDEDEDEDEEERMWIARRSRTKSKYPGMLDHIVAGGQPAGLGLMENVLKECAEEAGISEEITLAGITTAGVVSYETYEPATTNQDEYDGLISRSLLFNYDLDLPLDFTPKVVDGEVEEFFLWTIPQVMESMQKDYADPIKPNCYLVIIDFLLRKGYIPPETPGYLDLIRELRGGYCG